MRRILLLLSILLSAAGMTQAQTSLPRVFNDEFDAWMNAPEDVCLDKYAAIHVFFRGTRSTDSVKWTITHPSGSVFVYRASMGRPSPILWVNSQVTYGSRTINPGQSILLDMKEVGTYTIRATLYRRYSGTNYVREVEQTISVSDCPITKCLGDFAPNTNFKEDFGTFTAGGPRRPVTSGTIDYNYNSNPYVAGNTSNNWPLADDWYTVYYNAIRGGRPEWDNVDDHTNNGLGGMLIANSSEQPKTFYKREVNDLCPGAKYNFSAWFINLNSHQVLTSTCAGYGGTYQYAGVTFIIRNKATNAIIGQFYTGDVSMDLRRLDAGDQRLTGWQQFGGTVTLPPGVKDVTVEIKNDNDGGCGNDIAVDDINFEFCAPKIFTYIDGVGTSDYICPGAGLTVKATIDPIDYFDNPIYQWEMRRGLTGTWTPITAASGYTGISTPVLTIPEGLLTEPNVDFYYRLMVIESGNVTPGTQCYTPSSPVLIGVIPLPDIVVPKDSLCKGESLILTAVPLESSANPNGYEQFDFTGNYIMPWPSGPQPKDKILIQPDVTSTYIVAGTAYFGMVGSVPRYCTRRDTVTIYVDEPPVVNLGPDTVVCAGSPVTLNAGAANAGYKLRWMPSTSTTQTINVTAPPLDGDSIKPYLEVRNGQCLRTDTIKITSVKNPVANIQNVSAQCTDPVTTTYRLRNTGGTPAGKTPYTVTWEIVGAANGASLTIPAAAPNERDLINMPPNVPVRVRLTISSNLADCKTVSEKEFITYSRPTASVTETDMSQCSRTFTMTAQPLTDTSLIGTWEPDMLPAPFTIPASEVNNPNAVITYTGAAGTSGTVNWVVRKRNGNAKTCPAVTITVTLRYFNGPTVTIPSAIDVCKATPFTFPLTYTATNAPSRYDLEAIAPKMPGFVDIKDMPLPSTTGGTITVTYPGAAAAGTYRFRLTVRKPVGTTNDTCFDAKEFDVVLNTPSTTPTIGVTDGNICVGETVTLSIASGTIGSNSEWVWYRGDCATGVEIGRNVTSINVSPTATTTYSVRAIGSTTCGNSACVSTTVTVAQQPAKPNAGPDQEKCNEELFQLAASAPSVAGAVGTWTANPASVVFSDIHSPTSTARVFVGTSATLVWTITNGDCAVVSDTVILTNLNEINQNIIRDDQIICPNTVPAQIYDVGHPSSGTGTFTYSWLSSTTSATAGYAIIPGATGEYYQPGALTVTTWFRRIVKSGACTDTSAPVKITVSTNPPTVVTTPANINRECDKTFDYTTLFGTPTFQHPLGLTLTITHADVTVNNTCGMTITRTWTAEDPCGLKVTTSQTITVTDTKKPVLQFPGGRAPVDTTVSCSAIPAAITASATDNCTADAAVTVTVNTVRDASFTGTCVNNYVLIRTWTAKDNCNNEAIHTQRITVVDTSKPTMTWSPVLADTLNANCNAIPAAVTPTVTDNCLPAGVTVRLDYTQDTIRTGVANSCQNTYWLKRTWTATDACGNKSERIQIVKVVDNVPPTIIWSGAAPADVTVNCDNIPGAINPTATDNCAAANAITIKRDSVITRNPADCISKYTIRRNWTVTDLCGNASTHTQLITVQDTTRPTLVWAGTRPANVTANCDNIPGAVMPTATDNCTAANAIVIRRDSVITRNPADCISKYTIRRIWTATDLCNNSITWEQLITVQDTTRPTLVWAGTRPANVTVNCDNIPGAVTPTATDNCTPANAIVIRRDSVITRNPADCISKYTIRRIWTATDLCNNSTTWEQLITVQDTTRPTLVWAGTRPANVTVNCDNIPGAVMPTATDNCTAANAIVIRRDSVITRDPADCISKYTIRRIWTATDLCNNSTTWEQLITVQDTTRPTLVWAGTRPANVTVNCDNIPGAVMPTATDNCTAANAIIIRRDSVVTRPTTGCTSNYTIRRIWTATDLCNNSTTWEQLITVQDTTRPTLVWTGAALANVTVNCDNIPGAVMPTATDNCTAANAIVIRRDSVVTRPTTGCTSNYTIRRIWTATDLCNNSTTWEQLITVQDTTRPTLVWAGTRPANVTVNCDNIPGAVMPTATDNCTAANAIVIRRDSVITRDPADCAGVYTIRRIWTATDLCNNSTTWEQLISVQDTTRPTLVWAGTRPANVTVNCDNIPGAVMPTATDNCTAANAIVIRRDSVITRNPADCISKYTIRRIWTATDLCNNSTTWEQLITVQDTTRPTLVWAGTRPANVTVNCDNIPGAVMPTATDNCTAANAITIRRDSVITRDPADCISKYTIRRIWTATDLCNNSTTWEQLITVQDTTRPTLVWAGTRPANVTVNCDNIPGAVMPTATDNCTAANAITIRRDSVVTRPTTGCTSNYTIRRIWTATDLCNNSTTWEQLITVQDTTRPTLVWAGTRPANITVDCDNIPGAVMPTATDNCTAANAITIRRDSVVTRPTTGCISNYTIRRIWTATDLCNNSTTWEQLITVQDTTNPVLAFANGAPRDTTVNCDAVPATVTATATDNCTPANQVAITIRLDTLRTSTACISNYQIRRTWIATDLCGNTDTHIQLITVQDTTLPRLVWATTAPANITVNCDNIPGAVMPSATDNCSPAGSITIRRDSVVTRPTTGCTSNYTIRRIWTATDLCGNAISHEQLITVQDTTRPTLVWAGTRPANVTVNCDNIPAAVMPTATDNCTAANAITIRRDSVITRNPADCISKYTIRRIWTATDLCNNSTTWEQLITVQDTTRPTLVWAGTRPANVTVNCDNIPGAVTPTATDNCTPANAITIRRDSVITRNPADCISKYTIRRIWTATDLCNNSTTWEQLITVQDTTRPTLVWAGTRPANITVNCDNIPGAVMPTATDNCTPANAITIRRDSVVTRPTTGCTSNYTIRRIWTATDLCNNSTTWEQLITVQDTTRPTLVWSGTRPANITVDCDNIPGAVMPTATDNCTAANAITIRRDSVVTRPTTGCISNYTIRRIWTATDLCNNSTTWEQLITVQDTTNPVLAFVNGAPRDTTVNCDAVPATVTATATDNCTPANQVTITIRLDTLRTSTACISNYQIRRTWIATDLCGNTDTHIQLITVQDTTLPRLVWATTAPANITVNCDNIPGAVMPTATDNCTPGNRITIRRDSVVTRPTTGCTSNYTIRRIWTATDLCGNAISHEQLITVQDTTRPTLVWAGTRPANITVNCDNIPGAVMPTATDNCTPANAIVIRRDSVITRNPADCISKYTIRRIWTATDLCNNSTTWEQLITVQDTTRPTLVWAGTRPANITVNCDNIPGAVMPTATDNCTPANAITIRRDSVITRNPADCISKYTIRRIWTATDLCNNSTTWEQLITVQDTTRPTLVWAGTRPANITVNCDNIPGAVMPTATDNCTPANAITIRRDSVVTRPTTGCTSNYTIRRIWTATDLCNNSTTWEQLITVQDTTRPTMVWAGTRPANITVNCDNIPGAVMPTATDNCTAANVILIRRDSVVTRPTTGCISNYTIRRIWTATDLCGNVARYEQLITVQDTTRPVLAFVNGAPRDTTVNCDAVPATVTATATDNCTPANQVAITIRLDTLRTSTACISNYQIRRTWIATDLCGNTDTHVQLVTVRDTTRPTLVWTGARPANITVNCDNIPGAVMPTATDNCTPGNRITIRRDSVVTRPTTGCTSNYTIRRIWTATDLCGNAISHEQLITVQDTTRPTLVWAGTRPANVTANCDNIPGAVMPTATDNCTPGNQITIRRDSVVTRPTTGCTSNYTIRRIWTATDLCNNSTTWEQLITVQDTTRPTLVWSGTRPANVTVNCDNIPGAVMPTATDNCTPANAITIRRDSVITRNPADCISKYTIRRIWTATDLCNNSTTWEQLITVQDTTRPTLVWAGTRPANITVNCDNIPGAVMPTATDNCTPANAITIRRDSVVTRPTTGCISNYTIRRIWTATDLCNNSTTWEQLITVQDTTRPTMVWAGIAPANVTVNCDNIPGAVMPTATDNCTPANAITIRRDSVVTRPTTGCISNYTIRRIWTATDLCGNVARHEQLITVQDTTRPVFVWNGTVPASITVNCDAIPARAIPLATDNCTPANQITMVYDSTIIRTPGACVSNYQIMRRWRITDLCGNMNTHQQLVTVQDTTRPNIVWNGARPANITVDCDAIPAAVMPTATDNCTPANAIAIRRDSVITRVSGMCVSNYTIRRIWTVTDLCGNASTHEQLITVQDTTRPTLVWNGAAPANVTVNCDNIPGAVMPSATDNCTPGNQITIRRDSVITRAPGACISSYTIRRIWTATDLCNNSTSWEQLITVQDTTMPKFTWTGGLPADMTANCDALPARPVPTVSDNCTPANQITLVMDSVITRAPGACVSNYTIRRTWTATDLCGNVATHVQTVTVRDTTRPVLVWTGARPADVTVNCDAIPAAATAMATDNCTPVNQIDMDYRQDTVRASNACVNSYQLRRTWTATDLCGNAISHVQTVTVQDTTKPVMVWVSRPANVTVNCDAVPAAAMPTATDNCTPGNMVTIDLKTDTLRANSACISNYQLRRTWTATDLCGNFSTHVQLVTVQDTTKPVFSFPNGQPADATVSCDAIPATPAVNATDNCSMGNQVTVSLKVDTIRTSGACANNYRLRRTWTATDLCGNSATFVQTLTVEDRTAPVFTMPTPADVTVNCDEIPAQPDLTAIDNCSPAGKVTVLKNENRNPIPGACANNYLLIRTWTAIDECRNAQTVTQTITVVDTKAPVFTSAAPADTTVDCDKVPAAPNMNATDNCSTGNNVTVRFSETRRDIPGACINNYELIRTWTATDECGNFNTVSQTVTVQDTTAPVFTSSAPANATVECDKVPAQPDLSATDNCAGNVTIVKNEQRIDSTCANTYRLIRTWTATDVCGNSTTLTQTIIVADRTKPVFTTPIPADTTVNCDAIPARPVITASDNCAGVINVQFEEEHIDIPGACANNYRLLRTWTANDGCGNITKVIQVITVRDTTRPTFMMPTPADTTVNCDAIPVQPDLTATDNCSAASDVTVVKNETRESIAGACANNYRLIRTWTATDACGNARTVRQVVTVQDTTKPVFALPVPLDATVDCNAVPAQPDITATDNCSAQNRVTIVKNERREDIAGACANNYRLIRTWTATDECGNSALLTQVITVQDTTRPNFTMPVPADVTVNCDAIPTQPDLSVTDNCTATSAIRTVKSERREDIAGACVNNYRLIRTWTATDECGNTRTVTQVLTVQDTTRPTFVGSTPADATVECSAIPVQPNLNVTDNCSASNNVTVVKNERREDIPGACANNYRLIRTWTATDECGNSTTVQQVLTVRDTTAPVFTTPTPADATVECHAIPAQPDLSANDACSGTNVTIVKNERREDIPGACANNYRLIRTWTATDECGNSRTVTQVLTVVDNTKPVFNMPVPANATVECSAIPVQPDLTATDNCSPAANVRIVKYERREDIPGACANNYRLIRTWTATDECGNATTVTQTITVQDTTAPVFTTLPPTDITLSCSEVPSVPVMTATDNCSGNNVRIEYSFSKRPLSTRCADNYRLTRTWKAIDECGNVAIATQVITVMDTTKPTFTMAAPADTTVMCDALPAPVSINATDNCTPSGGVTVRFRSFRETVPGNCSYRIVNIWTAVDNCGNANEMRQVIMVIDTVKPVIAAPPADITLTCGQAIPTAPIALTATDNCSEGFPKQVQYTIDPYTPDLCAGYTITRRWKVTDNCGNAADDVIQQIHVLPCPKPELQAEVFTNCSTNPFITLKTKGDVNRPVYTLVGVTPANAVSVPMTSSNPRFNVNGATSASFVVRDGITGCVSDTVTYTINYLQMPVVNLGSDTSLCGGNGMVLDAGPANFGYQIRWSTGETTQRIRITRAGTYKVTVSNGMCEAADSIEVGVIPMPLIDLKDTTICRGQSVKLDATVEGNATYLWSTGATSPIITVSTQERFWVRVTKLGCITIDTVNVTVNPPPDVTLSRDTSICPGQSVMLTVNTNAGRIQWATGETSNSIVVSRAGTYQVAVFRDNCVVKEAVRVSERPDMKLELGPDRYMCPGSSILVDARHPDVNVYRWNDGDLNPIKTITQPGTYVLGVLDKYCDRYKTDSIKVSIAGPPTVNLGNDTIICRGRRFMLKANATNASRYLWSTGATTASIEVKEPGTYTVTAFNDCGSSTDEITIDVKDCDSKPEVPNAFSPNGDGKNDLFRPVLRGPMYEYELRIFNRWGELVYISKDQHQGWDGTYKGRPVDVGTFVWWLTYKRTTFGPAFIIKGDVTVIR
ncbi:gliding motility-associated C-terminal domain-containing protein [Chitinophaga caseinilytica]|uniref:gliding motility-associated C-terminal domain-containing protein n=1 Tax=Chitinophaga caseinilytica TaxID=2267521 RepID=UPI003C2C13ED